MTECGPDGSCSSSVSFRSASRGNVTSHTTIRSCSSKQLGSLLKVFFLWRLRRQALHPALLSVSSLVISITESRRAHWRSWSHFIFVHSKPGHCDNPSDHIAKESGLILRWWGGRFALGRTKLWQLFTSRPDFNPSTYLIKQLRKSQVRSLKLRLFVCEKVRAPLYSCPFGVESCQDEQSPPKKSRATLRAQVEWRLHKFSVGLVIALKPDCRG